MRVAPALLVLLIALPFACFAQDNDGCDPDGYGFNNRAACDYHNAKTTERNREKQWKEFQAKLTQPQREALAELRTAAEVYFDNIANNEQSEAVSASQAAAISIEAKEELETTLLENIAGIEDDQLPKAQASDFINADKALNTAYRETINQLIALENNGQRHYYSSNGVKKTQRSWLAYRDAWVKFGAARYPQIAADAWRAWLTEERTKAFACIAQDPETATSDACTDVVGHDF